MGNPANVTTIPEWLTLIAAVSGAAVLIINAFGAHWGRKEAKVATAAAQVVAEGVTKKLDAQTVTLDAQTVTLKEADGQLKVIHQLTNSSMEELKRRLTAALERIEKLENLLTQVSGSSKGQRRRKGERAA